MSEAQKLATIVALDLVGYSAKAEADQAGAAALVKALRTRIDALAPAHGGRVFSSAGDGFMLEFSSASGAVAFSAALGESGTPSVRAGVHMGDVLIAEGGDLLGHGVNVAARLMERAAPGETLISADVQRMIRGPLAGRLQAKGAVALDKIAERIEAFALAGGSIPPEAPAPRTPVLAVLAFDNLSADPELQFFSDGISEEILQTVSRTAQLSVIGRASSFQFRGADKAVRKVARELNASHVLDGSVRRGGAAVRVSAHLIEAATQTTLWSERFDRQIEDVFAVQDEIAQQVAAALDAALKPKPAPQSIDPLALELYLRGREIAAGLSVSAARHAASLLEEAAARAPNFAKAWGLLAVARSNYRWGEDGADEERARRLTQEAAHRALALDSTNTDARIALGVILPPAGAFAQLETELSAALDIMPNEGPLVAMMATQRMSAGRGREAFDLCVRAQALEPLHPPSLLALANLLFYVGREDEAIELLLSTVARWPENPNAQGMIIWTSACMGRWDLVERFSDPQRIALLPAVDQKFVTRAARAAQLIRNPSAEGQAIALAAAKAILARENVVFSGVTFPAFIGADLDALYDLIDAASFAPLHAPSGRLAPVDGLIHLFLRVNARFRSTPRFVKFCARLGLVDYWLESGVWPDCADETPYDFRAECARWAEAKPAP
ncbi:MAG: hypothetical protein AB7J28_08555 [Hyphomonadaceae bacterium]